MGLDRLRETPCGFCFVEYYSHQDALDGMEYIGGTPGLSLMNASSGQIWTQILRRAGSTAVENRAGRCATSIGRTTMKGGGVGRTIQREREPRDYDDDNGGRSK